MPFAALIGVEGVTMSPDAVTARIGWDPTRCTAGGLLHGGLLMSLADVLGGAAAFQRLPEGAVTATIQSATNFLRPVSSGYVEATSTVLNAGRRVIVIETRLTDPDGKLVASTVQSQAVLI
jgi:uncharacterized protein (TIGR00369 family)